MIGRRGRALIGAYVAFLVILFLMCSTDLIIREPEREVYQISVIIQDVKDDNYVNFRKGMEQAAVEFNGDVHFITLYEPMDADQQMELMIREQQDGAAALILVPADEERVVSALAAGQVTIPAVLLGSGLSGEGVAGTIALDYRGMGERLAREMVNDMEEDCQVLIFEEAGPRSAMSRLFLEGAESVFEESGLRWRSVAGENEGAGFEAAVDGLAKDKSRAVILAETPDILVKTAQILGETFQAVSEETEKDRENVRDAALRTSAVPGLYGPNATLGGLNYLDAGLISGACVTDQFSMGYLGVELAVKALEGGESHKRVEMDSYYIEKEDLRRPEYEMLLYPIE